MNLRGDRHLPLIVAPPSAAVVTPSWQQDAARHLLSVIIKQRFTLIPGDEAAPTEDLPFPNGDVHASDDLLSSLLYPSDFAPFKSRADVVLSGTAYAPKGSAPAMQLSFRFGNRGNRFERHIAVFGERRWQRTAGVITTMTEPRHFQSLPVRYEGAFGGPGYAANPCGTGIAPKHGPDAPLLLPQFEDPARLIKGPGDRPSPAGFGAIPMMWPQRWGKLGSYDETWLKERWPHFPADFDISFFQAAPDNQQLDYLSGDEPFDIVGMHPEHSLLSGRLPGLAMRCFAQRTEAAGAGFGAVVVNLDTAVFDSDAMTLQLLWRGLLEVSSPRAPEIEALFVMSQPLGEPPIELSAARGRFLAEATALAYQPAGPDAPSAANDGAETKLDENALEVRRMLAEAGVPSRWLRDDLTAAMDGPTAAEVETILHQEAAADTDVNAILQAIRDWAADAVTLRAQLVRQLAEGKPLSEMEWLGADLHELDLSGQSLTRSDLRRANLRGCNLRGCDMSEALLSEADLTDAQLDEATLTGADLTGAILLSASMKGVELTGASLRNANAKRADLSGAHGEAIDGYGADLTDARLAGAQLAHADLSEALLDGACFDGAIMPQIRLYWARAERASFRAAKLEGARADRARLLGCDMRGVQAPSSVWDKACLDGCEMSECVMPLASFADASLRLSKLNGAELSETVFREADLSAATLRGANLREASLEGCNLTGADLRDSNLYQVSSRGAELQEARLEGAYLAKTRLSKA